jgi:hypothetical protein
MRAEVEEKYELVSKGDRVRFVVNEGEGVNPVAEGVFLGKNRRGRYEIGERSYHRDEFAAEDLARIDEEVHEERVEIEFRQKVFLANEELREKGGEMFAERSSRELRGEGYTRVEGEWVSIHSLVKEETGKRVAVLARKLEPEMERKVFTANGFVLKDGEWKPSLKRLILGK